MKKFLLLVCIMFFSIPLSVTAKDTNEIELTDEEISFIESHPVITLGVDNHFQPYEFVDIDGEYKGMASDYIALIEEKTGLNFELYDPELDWVSTYDLAVDKQIDVLPCIGITASRREIFNFSDPYIEYQRVIFSNSSDSTVYKIDELEGALVGVQRNSSHHTYLTSEIGVEPILFDTVEQALLALSEGEIEVFVGNSATTSYILRRMNLTNLKLDSTIAGSTNQLAFAVRDDWPELVSIINKGLGAITEEERLVINQKWIGIIDEGKDYTRIIQVAIIIGSLLIIISGVSFFWVVKLKKEIEYRKKIEEELHIAKQVADDATKAKSAFLANMSHEIRTPMNAVIGLNRLLERTKLTDQQKDYVNKSKRASENLLGIINDILDFSKIEAGKLVIENIQFDLDDVIENISSVIGIKAFEKEIEFVVVNNYKNQNLLYGDPLRLGQVILNLTNNAIKFTPKGQVSLKIKEVYNNNSICSIEFSVNDTGIGMTKEQLDILFESFVQADTSTTRKFGGTGLGLAISKNLAAQMGSKIDVKSEYGIGSTFSFTLTFKIGDKIEEKNIVIPENLSNLKVMVIDDDSASREISNIYLEEMGITCTVVSSGIKAISLIDDSYDVIILDWSMPVMNGSETWIKIKSNFENNLPKVILMTAYASSDVVQQANEIGIDVIIPKPVNKIMLYNAIMEVFGEEHYINLTTAEKEIISGLSKIRGAHILVAEDNEINQLVIKETLENEGFIVDIAENGLICIEMFEKNKYYDLIFMDLQMPIMSGIIATSKLREKGYTSIPIIALTADVMTGVKDKVITSGLNGVVGKPFNLDELFSTLVKWIDASKINRELKDKQRKPQKNQQVDLSSLERFDVSNVLQRIGNKSNTYINILMRYKEKYENFTDYIIELNSNNETIKIKQELHTFKGASGNIGALESHSIVKNLESTYSDSMDISAISDFSSLSRSLASDIDEINKFLKILEDFSKDDETLSNDELIEQLLLLREYTENYDIKCKKIMEVISSSLLSINENAAKEIEKCISEYDYEKATVICDEFINVLK